MPDSSASSPDQPGSADPTAPTQAVAHFFLQAPAPICVLRGPDFIYELVNPAYQQLFPGRPLLGQPLLTALPEMTGQAVPAMLREVYATGTAFEGREVQLSLARTPEGPPETRYFDVVYQARRNEAGQVDGIVVFVHEVTALVLARQRIETLNQELETRVAERTRELLLLNQELEVRVFERTRDLRHARAETERQRTSLYQVFEQTPVAIAIMRGPELRIELANPAVAAIWGRPAGQILGQPYFEAVPDTAGQGFEQILANVLTTSEPFTITEAPVLLARAHTGLPAQAFVNFVFQPLHDADGHTTGLIASGAEVTEQVLARQRVEASQRQLRLITDALPVLIGYLDQERRYRFANHAYQAWFNQEPAALLGQTVWDVVGEAAYAGVRGYLDRALAGERLDFEAKMPYRADFTKYIRTSYVPDVQQGQVLGCFTLVTDITEQVLAREQVQHLNGELAAINGELRASNEELDRSNQQLRRSNADLDTFVYSASHDLKAPIANLEGLLQALREQLPADVLQAALVPRLLGMMDGAVARFQQTLGHLTDVVQLQPAAADAETVDLAALVEAVRLDLAPLLAAAAAMLDVDVADCPTVYFAPKHLRSIIYNLLSNGVKYHAPDRPPVVRLTARCRDQQIILTVQDNGLGLSEIQQGQLFRLFRRLHTHVDGSGVGLYMVRKIVDNANGTITVHSQPGQGSTFTVTLPD